MVNLEQLSASIIAYRAKNNLTQKEMAEVLEVSNKTICYIENQKECVRKTTLFKISAKMEELTNV